MKIALLQLDVTIGDISSNPGKIVDYIRKTADHEVNQSCLLYRLFACLLGSNRTISLAEGFSVPK